MQRKGSPSSAFSSLPRRPDAEPLAPWTTSMDGDCLFSFLLFSLPLKSVRISKKRKQDQTCIISRRWIEVHGRRETTEEGSSGLREDPRHLGDTTGNVEDAVLVSRRVKNGWGSIP